MIEWDIEGVKLSSHASPHISRNKLSILLTLFFSHTNFPDIWDFFKPCSYSSYCRPTDHPSVEPAETPSLFLCFVLSVLLPLLLLLFPEDCQDAIVYFGFFSPRSSSQDWKWVCMLFTRTHTHTQRQSIQSTIHMHFCQIVPVLVSFTSSRCWRIPSTNLRKIISFYVCFLFTKPCRAWEMSCEAEQSRAAQNWIRASASASALASESESNWKFLISTQAYKAQNLHFYG